MKQAWILGAALASLLAAEASAAPLMYHGNNPRITPSANPYNSGNLDKIADLTRPKEKRSSSSTFGSLSESDLLKRSLVSSLTSQYLAKLTGNTAGSFNIGDGEVWEYYTDANNFRHIIIHGLDGSSTDIGYSL